MSDAEQVEEDIEIDSVSGGGGATDGHLHHHHHHHYGQHGSRCVNVSLQIVFSTPGLVILVVVYSVMGALIFPLLEAPNEVHTAVTVTHSREECLKELWTITERLNVLYERNWTMLVHEQLRRFEGSIVAATKGGLIETMGDHFPRWTFSEALLYSVTVITTIGHGNLAPRTSEGKIVTMLYALIGVPLMLMCLSSLGGFLAEALQCTYSKLCGSSHQHGGADASTDCTQQEDEMDCNICKYDAVCKETTKLQTYDKYSSVNDREDSCHLIRSSPVKSMLMMPPSSIASSPHSMSCTQTLKNTNTNAKHYNTIAIDSSVKQHLSQMHNHHEHQPQQQQLQQQQLQQLQQLHLENSVAAAINGRSNTYFQMNRMQCFAHNDGINTAQQQQQQPLNSSYHGIQLQNNLPSINGDERNDYRLQQQQQQQQQHHHHTATVHGLGRSKFLPKPLPPEINMLLAECDVNCHHDSTESTTPSLNKCGGNMETLDDDDDEDNRVGCTHGTPSRIPLIKQQKSQHANNHHQQHNTQQPSIDYPHNGATATCAPSNTTTIADGDIDSDPLSLATHNPQVPITIILIILISYICIGTVIFSLWENWSIVDGAYFCFVTLSTIGFGDLVPKNTFRGPELQLFACCAYLVLGLVLVAMSFSLLETQLLWKCRRMAVRLKLAKE